MTDIEKLLSTIVDNGYSFGTGSWSVINEYIKMEFNEYGEYVPTLAKSPELFTEEEIKLLKSVTLQLSNKDESSIGKELFADTPNIKHNQYIGYFLNLYVGHVVEGNFRDNGSSGGFGTWILKELFENGYIDGVIHVTSTNKNEKLFEYTLAKTKEDIIKGAKTKYYPVEFSEVLKLVKKNPGKYAIIGLPSYIMSLRLLSEVEPVLKERIVYTIGLVCGHQKSTKFAEYLAWQCGIKPGKLEEINFRKKLDYLPSDSYGIEVYGEIGGEKKRVTKEMRELSGGNWGIGMFKVNASDFTDDVMNETADLTLGDAWLKEYTKDSDGNNILIVRNPTIQKILDDALKKNAIKLDQVDEKTIYQSQAAHFKHSQDELAYRLYKKVQNNEWVPKKRINPHKDIEFLRRKVQDCRIKITKMAPIYYKEAVQRDDIAYFNLKMKPLISRYSNVYRMIKVKNKLHKLLKGKK
ncbi:coenzyme F420-reducing hydrogenase subunit beta [Enterococcus casseliflavus]|uniref:Coenzyme F420-reducing hydrogenase subunit beta n=1 Tax=Enterococcus casseliflavus TaxID=37734 RepID=A0A6N3FQ14_ENTCA